MRFNRQMPPPPDRALLKEAYTSLYELVGASPEDHFIFTSSGAEGVNHAIFAAYLDITRKTGKNHFICSNVDEAAAILSMTRLKEFGVLFQMAPVNEDGVVTREAIAETFTPRTALVSISWVQALTGVIQPIEEIAAVCRERGVLLHVEASQALGKGNFTLPASGADLLSFDGEALGGPAGTGGLFIRKGVEISPFILGSQEQAHMRAGSLFGPALRGLTKTAQEAFKQRDHVLMEVSHLRSRFEEIILQKVPNARVLFADSNRVPHISCFLFPGVTSDALGYFLSQENIETTFGGGGHQHLMHILKASGIKEPLCHCGMSFSFSAEFTLEQMEWAAQTISKAVLQLQKYSQSFVEKEIL